MNKAELQVSSAKRRLSEELKDLGDRSNDIKQAAIDRTLARNDAIKERAKTISRQIDKTQDSSGSPSIVLGALKSGRFTHVAAQILSVKTGMSYKRYPSMYDNSSYDGPLAPAAKIYFYSLTQEATETVQANPWKRGRYGFLTLDFDAKQELTSETTLTAEQIKELKDSWWAGNRPTSSLRMPDYFNPIGALAVAGQIRKASSRLEHFENSLDMIQLAIKDPELNPRLAATLIEPLSQQLPSAA